MPGVTKKPNQRWAGEFMRRRMFLQYATIGISGIILDTLIFTLLAYGLNVNPALATIISVSCAITNNFIWNARVTFKKRDHLLHRFLLFFGVGSAGIVASALVLLLFADVFAFNALAVKLISLPPIVLGQYFLNKHFSFGENLPSSRKVWNVLNTHKALVAVYLMFAVLSVLMVKFTPYTPGTVGAPDEWQHYGKNVQFMLDNHRLPISGKDDIDSLSNCRDNPRGQVVCLYSYQFTPGFNYVTRALSAKVGEAVGISPLTGARLMSTLWGLLYVTGAFLIARLFLRYRWAVALTAIVAFVPQVIFTASYVSEDIHSLALSTMLVYTSLTYILFGRKHMRWWFYLSFSLLFVAKYNYFILVVVPAILLAHRWLQSKSSRILATDLTWMGGSALAISGPWFIRNLFLYHDFFGMGHALHEMSKFHALGTRLSFTDPHSYLIIFQFDSINTLFTSFFARFGYMYTLLDESYYTLLKLALVAGFVALWLYGNRQVRQMLLVAVALVVVVFGQVVANAFVYDWQFQGRYMFPVIAVLIAIVAFALAQIATTKHRQVAKGWLFGGLCVTAVVLLQSVLVVGQSLVNFYNK